MINHSDLPDHAIEAIARCIYPDILAAFQNEEVQKDFALWKAEQQAGRKREGKCEETV